MSKNTPGPWRAVGTNQVYRRAGSGMEIEIIQAPYVTSPEGPILITRLPHPDVYERTDEEITANLTLAAAAPDLLRAAKAMVGIEGAGDADNYREVAALRAAIAKAEGRASDLSEDDYDWATEAEIQAKVEWAHLNRSYLITAAYDGDETLYYAFMERLLTDLKAVRQATEGV